MSAAPAPVLTITLNPAIDINLEVPVLRPADGADFLRCRAVRRSAGGKGINVARVLTELGTPATAAFTRGGADGAVLQALMQDDAFEPAPLPIPQPTRSNITLTAASGESLKVNVPGPELSAGDWRRVQRALRRLMSGRAWVVLAGSLPPGLDVETYAVLTRLAHAAGAGVALDCEGEAMRAALGERPDLIKPNRAELATFFNQPVKTPAQIARAIQALVAQGCGRVVVSAGKGRVLAGDPRGLWSAAPPRIRQLSPMGAGDSMVAGLVHGLLAAGSLGRALRLGVACGAACAAEPDTVLAQRVRVRKLLTQVHVERFG